MFIQHAAVHLTALINIGSFFDTEALDVECTRKCGSCRCERCPIGGKSYTLKDERELRLIEEGLEHKDDHYVAQHSWIRDPKQLPDIEEFSCMQDRFQLICQMQWVLFERLLGQGIRPDEQLTRNNDQALRGTGCLCWGHSKNVPCD